MTSSIKLVLASSSPRRKELLTQLLFSSTVNNFDIVTPDIDETHLKQETPQEFVSRLAIEKALAGQKLCNLALNPIVIGSDTIVVCNELILGKPKNIQDAQKTLQLLSGDQHAVITAVAIVQNEKIEQCVVTTKVKFRPLTQECINAYIATQEPMDKAGSYGIQGLGGTFVSEINGSYSNVVGFPLTQTRQLLQKFIHF